MKYQYILFDFDGVLVESNEIRFNGFRKLFKDYPQEQVDQLVKYAKANGGVSRYKKIEFFFNTIRKEPISSRSVNHWANQFSKLVTQDVLETRPWERNKSLYICDSNNDLEAAKANNIDFIGRSSGLVDWKNYNVRFVSDLSSLYNVLH